jgi:predicted GNAT family acetyltransferase
MASDLNIADAPERSRFEVTVEGHTAFLQYRKHDDRLVLVHTEVPKELGGRGIGGHLVDFAVESAARQGLTISPLCPFAKRYLEKTAQP